MAEITVRLEGAEKIQKKLGDAAFVKGPLRDFLHKAGFMVEAKAKEKAPVDTGRLRASITTEVQETKAIVGPNLKYAAFVEFGTRPHFPPLAALQPWARRHGFPLGDAGALLVARAIAAHGTKPQPYLVPALEESKSAIEGMLKDMAETIEKEWRENG